MIATNSDNLPDWQAYLSGRGILHAALVNDWTRYELYGRVGIVTPLYDSKGKQIFRYIKDKEGNVIGEGATYHWRAIDGKEPKTVWVNHNAIAKMYFTKDIKGAIAKHGGLLHITSGQPDVLTMMAIGYDNTSCFFGEQNIPKKDALLNVLQSLGVTSIEYWLDTDETGIAAAKKLAGLFTGQDAITFKARYIVKGQDLNECWEGALFDIVFMKLAVKDATTYKIQPELTILEPFRPATRTDSNPEYDEQWRELKIQVGQKLGIQSYKSDGWSKQNVKSPFREDKNPSFSYNVNSGTGRDFGGRQYGIKELAAHFNLDLPVWPQPKQPAPGIGLKPTPAPKTETVAVPIISDLQAMDRWYKQFTGVSLPKNPPLMLPFKALHKFGGYAMYLKPRKLAFILGLSGGGKTSFMELMVDEWRARGKNGIWWGSEWSPEEYTARTIHRNGGFTLQQQDMYQLFHHEQAERKEKGKSTSDGKDMKALYPETYQKTLDIMKNDIQSWIGRVYYVDKMGVPLEQIIQSMKDKIVALEKGGRVIHYVIFDYIQLLEVAKSLPERERINEVATQLKAFASDNDLVVIVATQPRKGDSTGAKEGYMKLGAESMQFLRDEKCNSMITLMPIYKADGQKSHFGNIGVVKNSGGRTGSIRVTIKWSQLLWVDREV